MTSRQGDVMTKCLARFARYQNDLAPAGYRKMQARDSEGFHGFTRVEASAT
jgi:hypothetical protein